MDIIDADECVEQFGSAYGQDCDLARNGEIEQRNIALGSGIVLIILGLVLFNKAMKNQD
jgi:hypothetical protein